MELKNWFTSYLNAFVNYAYQWAELEDENGHTDKWFNAPAHKASTGIFFQGLVDVDLRFRYVSKVTYQEVPSAPVDDYVTVDMAVSKELKDHYFVKLSALNLLNDNHYEYPIYTQITRRVMLTFQYNRKDKCPSRVKHPFLSPLQGLLYYSIYQGLHPWLYTFSPSGLP